MNQTKRGSRLRQSMEKHKTREHQCVPCTIPFDSSDFSSIKSKPISESFGTNSAVNIPVDPDIDAVRRN